MRDLWTGLAERDAGVVAAALLLIGALADLAAGEAVAEAHQALIRIFEAAIGGGAADTRSGHVETGAGVANHAARFAFETF